MQSPVRSSWTTGERPLSPAERGTLVLRATLTMALFYLAALGLMLFCGVLTIVLFFVTLVGARFGVGVVLSKLMAAPAGVFAVLVRRMWLPSAPVYRVPLPPDQAPRLFDVIRALAGQLALEPPSRVFVEMHGSAWVMMRGFGRGSGRTTLGIGFDLLAALTTAEVEAVMAHELAHARLVRRGLSRWLNKGLGRLSAVTNGLVGFAEANRQSGEDSDLADGAERFFKPLTLRAARLVATYSRQDEFEADRLAAGVCGAGTLRSALTRLEFLDAALQRLPWNERLARARSGEHFTEWFVGELARAGDGVESDLVRHTPDPFSTHPSMRDRLAALPRADGADGPHRDAPSGVTLLADPDAIATRLMDEIDRVVDRQELRDTKRLARETRKLAKPTRTTAGEILGVILICAAVILVLVGISEGFTAGLLIATVGNLFLGVLLYRVSFAGSQVGLPIPAYGTLSNQRRWDSQEALRDEEQAVEAELRGATTAGGKRRRLGKLLGRGRSALVARDFLRVHVAARLARGLAPKSADASLLYAIGAAALGNGTQAIEALGLVRRQVGLGAFHTKWGAAWALSLLDDRLAEGLLQQLHGRRPRVATFPAMLARLQMVHGKLHSAIRNAETAVRLDPSNRATAELLVQLLLTTGRVQEAGERLRSYAEDARKDPDLAYLMVRTALMRRDLPQAREWADVIRSFDATHEGLLAVANAFGLARLDDIAAEFFTAALDAGYVPEARIGLAKVARFRGDPVASRRHLLAALGAHNAMLSRGASPATVFEEVLAGLISLEQGRTACRAWIATFPHAEMPLSERSLLVHAPTEAAAQEHLREIVEAIQRDRPPFDLAGVKWREAPPDDQPIRPIQPGVKGVVG
jgi:Zn-dependent protease with chaperone function